MFFTALVSADPALFRGGDKIEKRACRCTKIHRRGFFDHLADVQSACVKKLESRFDFISILRAKTRTPQPNCIQAEDVIAFRRDHERRNIFAECGKPLSDRHSADAHVLMKNTATAEKRAVLDLNVTTEQTIVRDDHFVRDGAVMSEMCTSHQIIVVSDRRRASLNGSAVNRDMLANYVTRTDPHTAFCFWIETQILRPGADDRSMPDKVVRSEVDSAFEDGM